MPDLAREIVAQATLAPSGGNCQPWHFHWGDDRLWVEHDRERSDNLLDGTGHATWLALGAAIENAAIAAAARGLSTRVEPFPHADVVAALAFEPTDDPALGELEPLIGRRRTNRRLGPRRPLPAGHAQALGAAAQAYNADLQLVDEVAQLETIGQIVGAADRIRFLCPALHREMIGELRWGDPDEPAHDGIALSTLSLPASGIVAVGLLARPDIAAQMRALQLGAGLESGAHDSFSAAAAAGLLTLPEDSPTAWLDGGRAMQRMWLEATALDIALQPVTALLYMFEMLPGESAAVFSEHERAELLDLETRLYEVFERPAGSSAMLFRLALVDEPAPQSPRLPVDRVLSAGVPEALTGSSV